MKRSRWGRFTSLQGTRSDGPAKSKDVDPRRSDELYFIAGGYDGIAEFGIMGARGGRSRKPRYLPTSSARSFQGGALDSHWNAFSVASKASILTGLVKWVTKPAF